MDEAAIKALIESAFRQFYAKITDQFKGVNDAVAGLKQETQPQPAPAPAPVAAPAPAPAPAPGAPQTTPAENAALLELRKSNEKLLSDMKVLQDARQSDQKRADDAERMSVVTAALGGFQFATPAAQQTAVEKIMPQLKRLEDGSLVAGNNLPPEAFIKDYIPTQHAYLLAPVGIGGAGLTPGSQVGQRKVADLSSIKPGMSAEDRAAAIAAIQQAASAA